jgi:AraC-like DNA-binding protein
MMGLVFASADVTRPLATSNPTLAELHERFVGEYLEHLDHAHTSDRTRNLIVRRLPDGEPRRDQIARELHMSERTLQRRLEEEATSFGKLLDDTRRELAELHLGRLDLSLAQAAYLLGFADQSSFFRACKRWFRLTPGQYREQLQARRSNDRA